MESKGGKLPFSQKKKKCSDVFFIFYSYQTVLRETLTSLRIYQRYDHWMLLQAFYLFLNLIDNFIFLIFIEA